MNITVDSGVCIDGTCSAPIPTSSQICSVSIVATNEFGSSNATTLQIGTLILKLIVYVHVCLRMSYRISPQQAIISSMNQPVYVVRDPS
jgi:predicted nucleic acid-binding Zn ribbon protein